MTAYSDLDKAIETDRAKRLEYAVQSEAAFSLIRQWLAKFAAEYDNEIKKALITGALSASVEVVSAAYLGLMRSAVVSLRTHFELVYAWLYYRDHQVEWQAVVSGSEQARLPGAIDQYLAKYYPQHLTRWAELVKNAGRKIKEPYGQMSVLIHSGSPGAIPTATKPADIVSPPNIVAQLPPFIEAVSESLSDVFVSCHPGNWHSLPERVRTSLDTRFSAKAKSKLHFD
jgi:hypothetical protein